MEALFLIALILGLGFWLLDQADKDIEAMFPPRFMDYVDSDYPDADYYRDGWTGGGRHE